MPTPYGFMPEVGSVSAATGVQPRTHRRVLFHRPLIVLAPDSPRDNPASRVLRKSRISQRNRAAEKMGHFRSGNPVQNYSAVSGRHGGITIIPAALNVTLAPVASMRLISCGLGTTPS